jgi:hypothetical protein
MLCYICVVLAPKENGIVNMRLNIVHTFVSNWDLIKQLDLVRDGPLEKWWGGGGLSKRQYIFFCTPIEENFFSHLMAGNIFFLIKIYRPKIYRPIFQGRNFFCTMPGNIFFKKFFLGINFIFGPPPPPPIPFLMVRLLTTVLKQLLCILGIRQVIFVWGSQAITWSRYQKLTTKWPPLVY